MPKAGKDNSKDENIPGCGRVFPRGGVYPGFDQNTLQNSGNVPRYGFRLLP